MPMSIECAALAIVLLTATPSFAASTDWLSKKQIDEVIRSWGGAGYGTLPKFYATGVDCKDDGDGPRFKMTYTALSGPKPYHRWNWVFAKSSDITKAVARLKRSDQKHLKYRVVQQSSFVSKNGTKMSCAIAYR
jgi:hypothetical protein